MKGLWLAPLVLTLAGAAPPAADHAPANEPAATAERWLFNSGERTARGRRAYQAGRTDEAVVTLDQALRLRPELPEARFNAGTGRLAAGDASAAQLLESAAREASAALAPKAWYNLGNSRLGGGDAGAAAEAYRESLRRDPSSEDAKFNLELALRELAKQQQQQQQDQQGGQKQQQQKQQPEKQDQQGGPEKDRQDPQKSQTPPPQGSGRERLRDFRDQPEMNAEQAAALLQAVENLERDQRRRDAQRRATERATVEIDW